MKKLPGANLLYTLLLRGASGRRMWASLIAMSIGLSLLLIAVLIWWNFNQLLHGRASDDSLGSTFLTVSRRVTNENMGHPELTVFSQNDIDDLGKASKTERADAELYGLIEAITAKGGKLLWSANSGKAALEKRFGPDRGPAIVRRLAEFTRVHVIK